MCERIQIDGTVMIVCGGRHHYCACGRQASLQCDWKVPDRKTGTCDAWLCSSHARQVGPDKHLCPLHQRAFDDWKRRRGLSDDELRRKLDGAQPSLFEGKE